MSEPRQPPRFVRSSSSEPGRPATASGDENWDDRFGPRGTNGPLQTIAVSGTNVYVGGYFTTVGETIARNIARWNSTTGTWSALGSGVDGRVDAIAVSG